MYTAKEAIITKEHSDHSECFVFRHDIRAYGKNFYEFTQRAQDEYGVKYYQTKISTIEEDAESNDLMIHYEDLKTGEFKDFRANLVVLATPLVPSSGTEKLASTLDLELDHYNFYKEKSYFNKALSSKEGIFCEPASAATLAGVIKKAKQKFFSDGDTVVCTLTGHGLKDPDIALKMSEKPVKVKADISAIEEILKGCCL